MEHKIECVTRTHRTIGGLCNIFRAMLIAIFLITFMGCLQHTEANENDDTKDDNPDKYKDIPEESNADCMTLGSGALNGAVIKNEILLYNGDNSDSSNNDNYTEYLQFTSENGGNYFVYKNGTKVTEITYKSGTGDNARDVTLTVPEVFNYDKNARSVQIIQGGEYAVDDDGNETSVIVGGVECVTYLLNANGNYIVAHTRFSSSGKNDGTDKTRLIDTWSASDGTAVEVGEKYNRLLIRVNNSSKSFGFTNNDGNITVAGLSGPESKMLFGSTDVTTLDNDGTSVTTKQYYLYWILQDAIKQSSVGRVANTNNEINFVSNKFLFINPFVSQ